MKGIKISAHLHNLIVRKRALGKSQREISQELNIPQTTVHRHINRERQNPGAPYRTSGRVRKTTSLTDRAIVLATKRGRFLTNNEIANQFGVSRELVRRRLSTAGIRSRLAVKDVLTTAKKQARVQWCRQNRNTNFNFWLFSDECSFEFASLCDPKRQLVHRKVGEEYMNCCILQADVKDRRTLMLWGVISRTGPVCFEFVDGIIDGPRYRQLLEQFLVPYYDSLPHNQIANILYQDDNARPHRVVVVRTFLLNNGINCPFWPAYSPDLKPIEHVWAELKKYVASKHPRTLYELRMHIRAAWRLIVTPEFCAKL